MSPKGIVLTSMTFALLTAAYVLYARVVVPRIERELPPLAVPNLAERGTDISDDPGGPAMAREIARRAFGEDAPEVKAPLVWQLADAEAGTTIFFFTDDYRDTDDGQIIFEPFSMVIHHAPVSPVPAEAVAGSISPQRDSTSLTTLRCLEARLRFEYLNLARFQAGKLRGGILKGDITLLHHRAGGDPNQPLKLFTRNVRFVDAPPGVPQAAPMLTTDALVRFFDGPNQGQGSGLDIFLTSGAGPPTANRLMITGMRALRLRQQVRMTLQVDPNSAALGGRVATGPTRRATSAPGGPVPLEISCDGHFQYDLETNTASFRDAVNVVYHVSPGVADRLQCEQLDLLFARNDGMLAGAEEGSSGLMFRKLWARGSPVLLEAPQNNLHLLATLIHHDAQQRVTVLSNDDAQVLIVDADGEVRAGRLTLTQNDQGELTAILAEGAGRMQRAGPQGTPLKAQWGRRLSIDREDGLYVLRLHGNAALDIPGQGLLQGDAIAVWLRPEQSLSSESGTKRGIAAMQPVRLQAQGAVSIESPQLSGKYDRLEMQFDDLPDVAGRPQPGATTPTPALTGPGTVAGDAGAGGKLAIDAGLLRVHLLRRGQQVQVAEVQASQNVLARQQSTAGAQGLVLNGHNLHVTDTGPAAKLQLTGNPAQVHTGELTLQGPEIHLDRAANRLDITGAGLMRVAVDQDFEGRKLATPKHLATRWARSMTFNGTKAVFRNAVSAQLDQTQVRCYRMDVTLQRPVSFADPGPRRGDEPIQIDRLVCTSNAADPASKVHLIKELRNGTRLVEYQHGVSPSLTVDVRTGDVLAEGPGSFVSVQAADDPPLGVRPAPRRAALPRDNQEAPELKSIEVRYVRNMTGNLNDRSASFHENVEVVYAPVQRADEQVDRFRLPEGGLWLRSDQLDVIEETRPGPPRRPDPGPARRPMLIKAIGNVRAELVSNGQHSATAHRMTYSETWDRLILQGRGSTLATLASQSHRGAHRNDLQAGRITYHPGSQKLKVDNGTVISGRE